MHIDYHELHIAAISIYWALGKLGSNSIHRIGSHFCTFSYEILIADQGDAE